MTKSDGHRRFGVEVGVGEAKARLSELLNRVESGDQVVITRRGTPIALLQPYTGSAGGRAAALGNATGLVEVADDFDAPLPDDVAAALGA